MHVLEVLTRFLGGSLYPAMPLRKGLEVANGWVSLFDSAGILGFDALWDSGRLNRFGEKPGRDISTMELGGKTLFVKRYYKKSLLSSILSRLEGSVVEWVGAHVLKDLGFKSFEPVAIGFDGSGRSILVIAKIEGERLEDFFKRDVPFEYKVNVTERLADFAARFHACGFTHQDFYLCHLFWNKETGEIGVIDLQRLRRTGHLILPWVIKDLAQIGYSSKNVLKIEEWAELSDIFWDTYTSVLPKFKDGRIVEKIQKKIARIERHDIKLKKGSAR
ncbi:MAG: lipopolysaccharide kinase InaA family protein [Dissulfurimicrobium sp.]